MEELTKSWNFKDNRNLTPETDTCTLRVSPEEDGE
jgi:hypothetical protein